MPPTLCARPKAGRTMVCALRSGVGVPPKGGAPTLRSVRSIFPAAHVAGKNDFILSAASAGNQEGAPAPSWNFPRTEDEGRKPPFRCLLLPVAPTIRLAAKRLRRRTPSRVVDEVFPRPPVGHDDPGVPPPSPRRAITTQSRRQNYQAFPTLVPHKAKTPESPQSPRPHPPSPVPTSFVTETPRTLRVGFQRKGRSPSFGRFKGVPGGNSKSPRESFLGSARGYSFDLKRISSRKPPTFVGGSPPPQGAVHQASDRRIKPPDAIRPSPGLPRHPWPVGQPPRRGRKPPTFVGGSPPPAGGGPPGL